MKCSTVHTRCNKHQYNKISLFYNKANILVPNFKQCTNICVLYLQYSKVYCFVRSTSQRMWTVCFSWIEKKTNKTASPIMPLPLKLGISQIDLCDPWISTYLLQNLIKSSSYSDKYSQVWSSYHKWFLRYRDNGKKKTTPK